MNLNLLPTSDLTEFLLLPADMRRDIESWQSAFCSIQRPYSTALDSLSSRMGVSIQTARRKYYAWKRSGWRGLKNNAKVPPARGLNDDLVQYWKTLCEQNGRKCRPAYREFVRRFKAGQPIPGIPAGTERHQLPVGLTYSNLVRYKPTRFELTASRIGRSAAAPFRPKLFTTRVGLSVGQRFIFDDMWHDFKVVTLSQRRPMRLLQLHAHDLFSGCQFARGLKPRMEDAETGKSIGLREDEMLFLVAHVLTQYGYREDGTVLMVEHGTAAIREDLEKALYDLSGKRITVERSGIEGASAFAGQYVGRGKGNFRFKAALESLGNLIHNETANLLACPGQTGSNSRLNLPEESHGRERHMDTLAMAIVALAATSHAAVIDALKLPYLEVNKAKWLVEEIMERINTRTDHELEGWLEAGLTTIDFDVPGIGVIPSTKFLALPAEKQAAIQAIANPAPRKMSPREVFEQGRRQLVRLRPEQSAALLLTSSYRPACGSRDDATVSVGNDHLICFEDQNISPAPLRYLAHHFAPGDKFRAVVNPWSPSTLHLFDSKGAWVGQVQAWQSVQHDDADALHRQMGAAAKVESELLAPLAARGAALTRQRLAETQANTETLRTVVKKDNAEISQAQDVLRKAADQF